MALIECPKCKYTNSTTYDRCFKCGYDFHQSAQPQEIAQTDSAHNAPENPQQNNPLKKESNTLAVLMICTAVLYALQKLHNSGWLILYVPCLLAMMVVSIVVLCKWLKLKKKDKKQAINNPVKISASTKTNTPTKTSETPKARYYMSFPMQHNEFILAYDYHKIPYQLLSEYTYTGEAQIEVDYSKQEVYILVNAARYGILTHEYKKQMVIDFMARNEPVAVAVEDDKTVYLGFYKSESELKAKTERKVCSLTSLSKYDAIEFAFVGDILSFEYDDELEKCVAMSKGDEIGLLNKNISEKLQESSIKPFGRIIKISEDDNFKTQCEIEVFYN